MRARFYGVSQVIFKTAIFTIHANMGLPLFHNNLYTSQDQLLDDRLRTEPLVIAVQ